MFTAPAVRAGVAFAALLAGCAPHAAVPAVQAPRAGVVQTDALSVVAPVLAPVAPIEAPPTPAALEVASGEATYYATIFNGQRTASGVVFHNDEPYAAHRSYPFGTVLRVINERNGREVLVTVVDRGPHGSVAAARGTIIDLSQSAAAQLDFIRAGRTPVRLEVLRWGDG
jgi:rare lipoprotein A